MTTTNRAIWGDAYRIMEKYENIPPGPYDNDPAYWDGMTRDLAEMNIRYRNDPMAWFLSCAIHDYISDRHKALTNASDGLNDEIRQDMNAHMFAQPNAVQAQTEHQLSML